MTPQVWRKYTDWALMVAAMIFLVAYSIEVVGNLSGYQAASIVLIIRIT